MSYQKQVAKSSQGIAEAKARAKDQIAQSRKKIRRADTRRKVLYGIAVLSFFDDLEPQQKERLLGKLHDKITKDRDRDFLGLSVQSRSGSESSE